MFFVFYKFRNVGHQFYSCIGAWLLPLCLKFFSFCQVCGSSSIFQLSMASFTNKMGLIFYRKLKIFPYFGRVLSRDILESGLQTRAVCHEGIITCIQLIKYCWPRLELQELPNNVISLHF